MLTPDSAQKIVLILKQEGVSEETCMKVAEELKAKVSTGDTEKKEPQPVEEPKAMVAVIAKKPNALEEMLRG